MVGGAADAKIVGAHRFVNMDGSATDAKIVGAYRFVSMDDSAHNVYRVMEVQYVSTDENVQNACRVVGIRCVSMDENVQNACRVGEFRCVSTRFKVLGVEFVIRMDIYSTTSPVAFIMLLEPARMPSTLLDARSLNSELTSPFNSRIQVTNG
jgi:hypothetical protein